MELTAEERRKIYEEEKARIEAEQASRKTRRKETVEPDESRTHRITSSSIAIAWCLALLILFLFFRHYLAYYQIEQVNGVSAWVRYEILNADFNLWLPILTITLALSIIGHILALIFDTYLIRHSILTFLNLLGIGTVAYLLYLFPFNFSAMGTEPQLILLVVLKALLAIILVIMATFTLTYLVKFIVRVATGNTNYYN